MSAPADFDVQATELLAWVDREPGAHGQVTALEAVRALWPRLSATEQAERGDVARQLKQAGQRIAPPAATGQDPTPGKQGPTPDKPSVQALFEAASAPAPQSSTTAGSERLAAAFAALEDEPEAQRALQGLEHLRFDTPLRFYDGPPQAEALLAYFGLEGFRAGQREAVQAALDGRDSLVIMPTGGGKSLCYQLPGLASDKLTIVVSPLIALIADQHKRLRASGHPSVMLASGLEADQIAQALDEIESGQARIVFCAPERFGSAAFMRALAGREIGLFVVDEAHCLSEWGHDFRPDYLRLGRVHRQLGRPPLMACTATATEQVAEEISRRLALHEPVSVRSGFDRPNLSFDVLAFDGTGAKARKYAFLDLVLAQEANRPAIIYCGTRKDVEEVSERLAARGLAAVGYHGAMEASQRASAQHQFMSGDADVVVATNAFGMGVDKADVRLVCHWATPTSVEAYYQEAGRGGRDGQPARAVLLASRADLGRLINFIKRDPIEPADVLTFLRRMRSAADADGKLVRDAATDDHDRVCLGIAERAGALRLEPADGGRLRITLAPSADQSAIASICRLAQERKWQAYHAIKAYATVPAPGCRRRSLLQHFGDTSTPAPLGRCCDACDPDTGLPDAEQLAARAAAPKPARKRTTSTAGTRAASSGGQPQSLIDDPDYDLLLALREWRKQAAAGKPAYTVAHNTALEQIAASKPSTAEQLLAVKGIGEKFVLKHGRAVLDIVAAARR